MLLLCILLYSSTPILFSTSMKFKTKSAQRKQVRAHVITLSAKVYYSFYGFSDRMPTELMLNITFYLLFLFPLLFVCKMIIKFFFVLWCIFLRSVERTGQLYRLWVYIYIYIYTDMFYLFDGQVVCIQ